MIGTHHLPTKQNGRLFRVTILFALILSILCGCSANVHKWLTGDSRGDWKIELINDYYLFKSNSKCKTIDRADVPEGFYSTVIDKLYVTDYQVSDPYIYVCGIKTQELFISDEEKTTKQRWYYLVDTVSGEVSGPFDSKESFEDFCNQSEVQIPEEWIVVPK